MPETSILSCFSSSYVEARKKFLDACESRSLSVDSRLNPNAKGVSGENLYADIVQIGSPKATKVLLLLSGTHGVEGYCGSGAQIGFLNQGYFDGLPEHISVIMIHAMNPYGFSHNRRVTEDNVDLNRNFIDFSQPGQRGKDYAALHEYILPRDWGGPDHARSNAQIARFIEEQGAMAFQAAVSSGQYRYPDGIFYGGKTPTWSNQMFRSFLSDYLIGKEAVGTIDFHTGLGRHGYGELIAIGSAHEKTRAASWYGSQVTDPEAGTSSSANLDGMVAYGIAEALSGAELTFVTLEFGTFEINRVLTALRGDNWLYHNGDLGSDVAAEIKREIKEAYYPETEDWKLSVWARASEIVPMALKGLDQD